MDLFQKSDGATRASKSTATYRTISEVAKELDVATHVLRFWESKFDAVKPLTRAGNRRYYTADDIAILRRIQALLHDEGYTIKGVQTLLKKEKKQKVGAVMPTQAVLKELRDIRALLTA